MELQIVIGNRKNMILQTLTWVSRIIFGLAFIFAGFTKAIDPLGTVYVFDDYFVAFGIEWLMPLSLPLAIILNTLELLAGIAILLGLKMYYSAWAGLLFMIFFTPITLYIAITDAVPHCGCFGDAWIISNWETFYKNIILLAASILIFTQKNKITPLWSAKKDWWLVIGITVVIFLLSLFCLRNLPLIDFRPWKVGNDITEQLKPLQKGESEFIFIYKNEKTGEEKEFELDNLPSAEDGWNYVDRKEVIIKEHIPSPIENFDIRDEFENDLTSEYIGKSGYLFLVVAYNLNTAKTDAFSEKINNIAEKATANGYSCVLLTNSTFMEIDNFRKKLPLPCSFYQSDERELKTIIRSNPGLVLLKDGIVIAKWHHRNIPSYQSIKEKYFKDM